MKRFHLHVAVDNLEQSIQFYSALFATQPTVQKSDYAKWMLEDPRVNFAISQCGAEIGVNHLGIQVESDDELKHMQSRLASLDADLVQEDGMACCYAKSDKYWVNDPSGIAWETFHTLDTIPVFGEPDKPNAEAAACCIPLAKIQVKAESSCCVPTTPTKEGSACC